MLGVIIVYLFYVSRRTHALKTAMTVVAHQDEPVAPEFIAAARKDAQEHGVLNEFNEEISKTGTPITYKDVIVAHKLTVRLDKPGD